MRFLVIAMLLMGCGPSFSSRCVVNTPVVAPQGRSCTLVRDHCLDSSRYTIECRDGQCTCAMNGVEGTHFVSDTICFKDLSPQQDEFFTVGCGFRTP